jgi:hypothetical protein
VAPLRKELTEFLSAASSLLTSHANKPLSPEERSLVDAYIRDMPVLLVVRKGPDSPYRLDNQS